MDRREFLTGLVSFGALLAMRSRLGYGSVSLDDTVPSGEFVFAPLDSGSLVNMFNGDLPRGPCFVMTNTHSGDTSVFPAVPGIHSIILLRGKTNNHVALIPKHGSLGMIFNLSTKKVTKSFNSSTGLDFFGHAVSTPDGQYFICGESAKNVKDGTITVRDSRDGRIVQKFLSHGQNPHEMLVMPDGKTLLIANAGPLDFDSKRDGIERSCLAFVDLGSGKIVNKLISTVPDVKIAHFSRLNSGRIFVGGVPGTNKDKVPGRVLTTDGKKDLTQLDVPDSIVKSLVNETLSVVASDDKNLVAVSMPYSNRVLTWQADDLKFRFATTIRRPTGLGFLNDSIVVGAEDGQWFEISPKDGKILPNRFPKALAGNQTHLTLAKL